MWSGFLKKKKNPITFLLFFIFIVCVCVSYGETCKSQPFLSTVWIPETELRSAGLVVGGLYLLSHLLAPRILHHRTFFVSCFLTVV